MLTKKKGGENKSSKEEFENNLNSTFLIHNVMN